MRMAISLAAAIALFPLSFGPSDAEGVVVKPNAAKRFVTLPEGIRFPEGIAAKPSTREVFVGTFDASPGSNSNELLRFNTNGNLIGRRPFGATPLLGLAYNHFDDKVYIANFGASEIQRIEAGFDAFSGVESVATIPSIGPPGDRMVPNPDGTDDTISFGNAFAAPNALTFDSAGNLYVSDSFQGAVFRIDTPDICAPPCPIVSVIQDPLLATAGFPPFGANGIVLSADETELYVANTGDDRILRVDLGMETVEIFAESVNGADGLAFDAEGRLWVAANQADQIVVLDANGRVIAELGEFGGLAVDGAPQGLSFPASIAFVGRDAFVTNLAVPLTMAVGDEPEEDITSYTLSRIGYPALGSNN